MRIVWNIILLPNVLVQYIPGMVNGTCSAPHLNVVVVYKSTTLHFSTEDNQSKVHQICDLKTFGTLILWIRITTPFVFFAKAIPISI